MFFVCGESQRKKHTQIQTAQQQKKDANNPSERSLQIRTTISHGCTHRMQSRNAHTNAKSSKRNGTKKCGNTNRNRTKMQKGNQT